MSEPPITRLASDLPNGGQARVWIGKRFVVSVLNGVPLVVAPPAYDGPTLASFAQALDEAAAHCPASPDERN